MIRKINNNNSDNNSSNNSHKSVKSAIITNYRGLRG